MTSLLLWKEHLKRFYNRYSYGIQPVVRFLFALCTMVSLNTNIGYMAKLKSPLVILPVCLVSVFLPYGAIVFLAGACYAASPPIIKAAEASGFTWQQTRPAA